VRCIRGSGGDGLQNRTKSTEATKKYWQLPVRHPLPPPRKHI
jgi:hypothetical protein